MRVLVFGALMVVSACSSAPPWSESATRMCTAQVACVGDGTVEACESDLAYTGDAGCEGLYDEWLACLADAFESDCSEVESYIGNTNTTCSAEDIAYFDCSSGS